MLENSAITSIYRFFFFFLLSFYDTCVVSHIVPSVSRLLKNVYLTITHIYIYIHRGSKKVSIINKLCSINDWNRNMFRAKQNKITMIIHVLDNRHIRCKVPLATVTPCVFCQRGHSRVRAISWKKVCMLLPLLIAVQTNKKETLEKYVRATTLRTLNFCNNMSYTCVRWKDMKNKKETNDEVGIETTI